VRADIQSIQIVQGDDLRLSSTVEDQGGDPVDISGAQDLRWAVGRNGETTADAELTLGSGVEITTNDGYYVDISAAISGALSETTYWPELRSALVVPRQLSKADVRRSYWHQVRLTTSAGKVHTILDGRLFVRPAVPATA